MGATLLGYHTGLGSALLGVASPIVCGRSVQRPSFNLPRPSSYCASHPAKTRRLQVLRRSNRNPRAQPTGGRGGSQRLRQVEHHRRRALGIGRSQGVRTARRVDAGRHLQWLGQPQAGCPRLGRDGIRQYRRAGRGPVERLFGNRRAPRVDARRHQQLLRQQPAGPAARHPRHLPGHRPGRARLRHHRPGHDQPPDRGPPGRAAGLPRRGGRGVALQRAPPRDREPPVRYAREPDPGRGHPARTGQPARQAGGPGRGGAQIPRTAGRRREKAVRAVAAEGNRRPR
ncbi:Uncharacterised protein [Bordetella pertussis]|nr:Uncharacterised protein [Bordetella pertussis]CFL86248.1 Uncharacterised protein [Bordetella pertussis]CFM06079.1 Uncharacterised protein [Bordetella pertussis]CFM34888.1 Uncharacterised protein [Bordetella pertussis]CFM62858.1 Uncharacterised protein [Bordetella pertussis]